MVLDLIQYRTYASSGEAVIGQYVLPEVMINLLYAGYNLNQILAGNYLQPYNLFHRGYF